MHELERSRAKDPVVYLDMTQLDAVHIRQRFPRIFSTCMQYNIDITSEMIPVRPAAHYAMGGVRTDLHGRTTVSGLYAAGEAAGTGVHGANRLASNSLLEGLVFGARAGRKMRAEFKARLQKVRHAPESAACSEGTLPVPVENTISQIQELMWKQAGIVRTGSGLKEAIEKLENLGTQLHQPHTRRDFEARNLQINGTLVARSALAREESRGAHYRTDFPDHNDVKFRKHSVVAEEKISFD
jgi:L-aspartate oxidase